MASSQVRNHAFSYLRTSPYMIHEQVAPSPFGAILHDEHCTGDCAAFKGIGFRFLTKLYEVDTQQTQYHDVLHASAQAIWALARNPKSNTFAIDWAGPPTSSTSIGADASAVMALNLAAEYGL